MMGISNSPILSNTIDRNNRYIVALIIGGFGLLGSLISILVSLSAICILVLIIFGKVEIFSSNHIKKIAIVFGIYFLVGSVQALVHLHPKHSLDLVFMRLPFLEFLPFVSAFAFTKPEILRQTLEKGASIGAILTLLYVIFELVFLHERAWGGAGNPGPFATVTAGMFLVCVLASLRNGHPTNQNLYYAGALAAALCVMASGMRSMLPVLFLTPILAWWLTKSSRTVQINKIFIFCLFGLLIFAFLPIEGFPGNRIYALFNDYILVTQKASFNNSLGHRLIMWEYAVSIIPNAPFFGFGIEESRTGLSNYALANYDITFSKTHFHNAFITALMRGGILDLLALCALLFTPLLICYYHRSHAMERYGFAIIAGTVLVYFCSGILNLAFHHDIMDHFYVFMISIGAYISFAPDSSDEAVK